MLHTTHIQTHTRTPLLHPPNLTLPPPTTRATTPPPLLQRQQRHVTRRRSRLRPRHRREDRHTGTTTRKRTTSRSCLTSKPRTMHMWTSTSHTSTAATCRWYTSSPSTTTPSTSSSRQCQCLPPCQHSNTQDVLSWLASRQHVVIVPRTVLPQPGLECSFPLPPISCFLSVVLSLCISTNTEAHKMFVPALIQAKLVLQPKLLQACYGGPYH
mmetsp:Transcript_27113/g.46744  ORF Transcript_27113/g.46744 Transcript_27113/m.46744 type:complete len:212 (+) Transcript_27113:378-1013(+)